MSKVPPTYSDLGKSARDLFDIGYNYGSTKVDLKTKSVSGVEFTLKGSSANKTGQMCGSLETKYQRPSQRITFTEKWTTSNVLYSEVSVEDQLANGLKMTLCTSFSPSTGKKSANLKAAYKRDYIHLNLDSNCNLSSMVQGDAVVGSEGWLVGYEFAFDTSKSVLSKSNMAFSYTAADLELLTTVNDCSDFRVFQRIDENLSTGIHFGWTEGQSNTRFGVAAKYDFCDGCTVNAKLNNAGQIGLGYTHKLRDGIKLTLSSLVEGKNFNAGGHQLGLGLEFEV